MAKVLLNFFNAENKENKKILIFSLCIANKNFSIFCISISGCGCSCCTQDTFLNGGANPIKTESGTFDGNLFIHGSMGLLSGDYE